MRFLYATNYWTDHIMKRFHEENSAQCSKCLVRKICSYVICRVISMAFSENDKKIPKLTYTASRTCSHFWQKPNFQSRLSCKEMNINRVTLQRDREFIMFRFHFSLFMVLLCVIFKSIWYLRKSLWVLLHVMFMYDWKQAAQWLKLQEML